MEVDADLHQKALIFEMGVKRIRPAYEFWCDQVLESRRGRLESEIVRKRMARLWLHRALVVLREVTMRQTDKNRQCMAWWAWRRRHRNLDRGLVAMCDGECYRIRKSLENGSMALKRERDEGLAEDNAEAKALIHWGFKAMKAAMDKLDPPFKHCETDVDYSRLIALELIWRRLRCV